MILFPFLCRSRLGSYCMIFDFWMYEDGIQPGHVIVIDLKGCSLGHVARIGLLQMKKFLFYLQVKFGYFVV